MIDEFYVLVKGLKFILSKEIMGMGRYVDSRFRVWCIFGGSVWIIMIMLCFIKFGGYKVNY